MAHRYDLGREDPAPKDLARGRDLVSRWCDLAERRLEHLTELFETGRWRLYHSESAFIENIREAKAAVETWRDLLTREASRDNYPLDLSWLGRGTPTLPLDAKPRWARPPASWPTAVLAEPSTSFAPSIAPSIAAAGTEDIWIAPRAHEADTAPVIDMEAFERELSSIFRSQPEPEPAPYTAPEVVLDFAAIQDRYPLLRNAL
jgi:uncharacterized repeat protein (TIGR03809 family)